MTNYTEQPFQFLRRKKVDGITETAFSPEIIENWYKARAYVLDKLENVKFGAHSNNHLHVVLMGDTPLMLSVARQVALSAHYINFDEGDEKRQPQNRTVITIVTQRNDINNELLKEEYLCNLLKYCKCTIYGDESNTDSYIDIELEVVKEWKFCDEDFCIVIKEEDVANFYKPNVHDRIDTRKAVIANRIYNIGTLISNIPYEDIHDTHRYSQALDAFQYIQMEKPWELLIGEKKQNRLTDVKEALSNIFCTDCFKTREMEINMMKEFDLKNCSSEKEKKKIRKVNYWDKYIEALSKSEHARWVVEKLIMGYRPLNMAERIEDERIIGAQKQKEHRKQLKSNSEDPVHIDLCSCADLRRIDPDNMKYDSFLMLAIPEIMKKCSQK